MTGMTTVEDDRPSAVGAYWIKEEHYATLLDVFTDGNRMPRTRHEWLKIAEEMERGLIAYGHVVLRVFMIRTPFRNGASPTARARVVKDEKDSLLQQ
jgi:hypothetical protein